jgi:hypothetical protein
MDPALPPSSSTWEDWFAQPTTDITLRRDRLVELVWAASLLNDELAGDQRRASPRGEPRKAVMRAAGEELTVLLAEHPDDDGGDSARQMLAAMGRNGRPVRSGPGGRPSPDDEINRRYQDMLVEVSRVRANESEDPFLVGFTVYRAGVAARSALQNQEALDLALDAITSLTEALRTGAGPSSLDVAVASIDWREPTRDYRGVSLVAAWQSVVANARALGDFALHRAAVLARLEAADQLEGVRPDVTAKAISAFGGAARQSGDRARFRAAEERLEQLWQHTGHPAVRRAWSAQAAANADYLGNREGGRRIRLERIAFEAATGGAELGDGAMATPAFALAAVPGLEAVGARLAGVSLGNAAYDLAYGLHQQRATETPGGRAEALGWCDVAGRAWAEYGVNGFNSLRMMRARVDAAGLAPDDEERDALVGTLLEVATDAVQGSSRVGALTQAAETARAGDTRVRDAIVPRLARSTPRDAAQLRVALAEWQLRSAQDDDDLRQAQNWGLDGATGLRWAGLPLDPQRAGRGLIVAAESGRRLGEEPEVELTRLLGAVRCMGIQLTTSVAPRDRAVLSRVYAPALRRAAELTVELDDEDTPGRGSPRAMDLIMEAVRRDRVGTLLTELTTTPGIAERIRRAAETVLAANTAVPTDARSAAAD